MLPVPIWLLDLGLKLWFPCACSIGLLWTNLTSDSIVLSYLIFSLLESLILNSFILYHAYL